MVQKYLQIGDGDLTRMSDVMYYKDEMRRLIDIVKNKSLNEPLQSTLEDMKMLTTAVKDLNDRIEIRVRKSLVGDDKKAKKKLKIKFKASLIKFVLIFQVHGYENLFNRNSFFS